MATSLRKPKKPPKPKKPEAVIRPPMGAAVNSSPPEKPTVVLPGRPSAPGTPGFGADGRPQGVAGAPPPTPAQQAAAPGFIAPVTRQGATIRSTAEGTYQAAMRQGRQGIVDAAIRLGSPEIINALLADPNFAEYAGVLQKGRNDPSSQFSLAARDEKEGLESIDSSANAGNTFFSSKRVENRQDLSDDYSAARSGYLRDYTTGYNTLTGNMGAAKAQYEQDLGEADRVDTDSFLATAPVPTGPDPAAPAAAAEPPKPKPGYDFVQTTGSRAGLSYNVEKKNGKKFRRYENGDVVRVNG
jgi:hypothetical protein